jgi:ribosomal protein L32
LFGHLLSRLQQAENEIKRTRELMSNPHMSPPQKVVGYNALIATGAAPGRTAVARPKEHMPVTIGTIARRSGLTTNQAGTQIQTLVVNGLLRKQRTYERLDGETDEKTGKPKVRAHISLAPPDGEDWTQTWGNPARIEHLTPAESLIKDRQRKSEERKRVKAIKAVLAECPSCGCADLDQLRLVCKSCGTSTPAAELKQVPVPDGGDGAAAVGTAERGGLASGESGGRPARHTVIVESGMTTDSGALYTNDSTDSMTTESVVIDPLSPESVVTESMITDCGVTDGPVADDADGEHDPLSAAVSVLAPAFTPFPNHIVMRCRHQEGEDKYYTRHHKLTRELIEQHLRGKATLGAGLLAADLFSLDGCTARVLAWDSDDDLHCLINGGMRLRRWGLYPLLVQNPTKAASGHLFLLFSRPVDPTAALAAAETIGRELRAVPERFPDPNTTTGGRLRLPGGVYLPVGGTPVPVRVALAPEVGQPAWVDATTVEGLRVIAGAVSDPAILEATYVPPELRPKPRVAPRARPPLRSPAPGRMAGSDDFFARFNREHPLESMVDIGRDHKFSAPWREERTPSVHVYDDGHWHDFGPDGRHGKDAFDLYCAINGYWDTATNKPDRKAAYRALTRGASTSARAAEEGAR